MDQGVMVFAQVMAVVMGSIAALVGIGLGTRVLWRLGSQPPRRAAPALADSEELQRLQTAIDAIAIEVERISEGQRFVTKVMSDRSLGSGAAEPVRVGAAKSALSSERG